MIDGYNTVKLNTPIRLIKASVELFNGSTLSRTITEQKYLKSITIERVGVNNKFFGFGICQKLNLHLTNEDSLLNITTANSFKIKFGIVENGEAVYADSFPTFHVTEVHKDEVTGELSITAYDSLYNAAQYKFNELALELPYTVMQVAVAIGEKITGNELVFINFNSFSTFGLSYAEGANFEGTEDLRAVLDAIAEVTQSIYFLNNEDNITFKRLSKDITDLEVNKSAIFSLKSGENRRLSTLISSTELGDNLTASITESGSTQYIRNNPFYDLREDRAELLNEAISVVGGFSIGQFESTWRGNYYLEIGDRISFRNKDNSLVFSYILDDVIEYSGGFIQKTQWSYEESENEGSGNPTNLGESIKQTYAKVNKVDKRITILTSETSANSNKIATIEADTESIKIAVEDTQKRIDDNANAANESLNELKQKVEASVTSTELEIKIKEELSNGVEKVETATGFTFDENGLKVSKSNSEMETTITEDGMRVYRDNTEVLIANNKGVVAKDLHAETYLIIGTNSRLEDYSKDGEARTGCFWIGG